MQLMVIKYFSKFIAAFIGIIFFLSANAQKDAAGVAVNVSLDRSDWVYAVNEKARFTISVWDGSKNFKDAKIHCEIGEERMQPSFSKDMVLKDGTICINGGTMHKPGFLRCVVTAELNGKKYKALATAAFAPDNIRPYAKMPADFQQFWDHAVAETQKIPLTAKKRLLAERCTEKINVYEVSFQNDYTGSRIYGILCTPKKEGKYPAILETPGAGFRSYKGDTALAEKGVVTLQIGIHGIPVTLSNEVYYGLAFGALKDYYFFNLDDRDRYYYKRVYLGCLRSVDFLLSLPQVDSSRLAVYGGSQGGALSIVTAALDHRIKYLVALYPALSDLAGYFHQRAGGWPHMFAAASSSSLKTEKKIETSGYYDAVNFARLINVPGFYSWGYNDEVCPPTTSYAAYNSISAPKEKFIQKESGHWLTAHEHEKLTAWLLDKLQVSNSR